MDYDPKLDRHVTGIVKGIDVYGLTTVLLVGLQIVALRVEGVEETLEKLQERVNGLAAIPSPPATSPVLSPTLATAPSVALV